ncbi:MAG: fatty acyl-AMP ligase [Catenulispora sp.]|nr:fatty acyl-AMP ligase [Catenulispora sp.]
MTEASDSTTEGAESAQDAEDAEGTAGTGSTEGTEGSLIGFLRRWAATVPDRPAYVRLRNGEEPGRTLTFEGLARDVAAVAAELTRLGLRGQRAVLLYPHDLDFAVGLLGCQAAGVTGVPVKVPNRPSGSARVRAVAADAGARAVLTTSAVRAESLGFYDGEGEDDGGQAGLHWVQTDRIAAAGDAKLPDADPDPDDLALLQYTSGSTGTPRGAMVTHRNLVRNALELDRLWPGTADLKVVSWLPLFHDMGLMFGIVMPLWAGATAYLMSPEEFIRRPMRWLEAVDRFRGTHTAAPNFAYDLCVRSADTLQGRTLDLSSWRVAVNGAEPVRWHTVRSFTEVFAPHGLRPTVMCPGYGLAENTLKVSGNRADVPARAMWADATALRHHRVEPRAEDAPGAVPIVDCGAPDPDSDVRIVDPDTAQPCPPGAVGEVWVHGPCVAAGYWSDEERTARVFGAELAGRRYLRTGDLGFLRDGSLYITGRIKDVIICRGRNHYPQDIEHTVELVHPALPPHCAAAFSAPGAETEEAVVVVEVNGRVLANIGAADLAAAVGEAVERDHALPVAEVVLIRRGTLPRTSSGKVRRQTCREEYLDGTLARLADSGSPR